jgi:hypothetical protein
MLRASWSCVLSNKIILIPRLRRLPTGNWRENTTSRNFMPHSLLIWNEWRCLSASFWTSEKTLKVALADVCRLQRRVARDKGRFLMVRLYLILLHPNMTANMKYSLNHSSPRVGRLDPFPEISNIPPILCFSNKALGRLTIHFFCLRLSIWR